jgi:hypothetical protein
MEKDGESGFDVFLFFFLLFSLFKLLLSLLLFTSFKEDLAVDTVFGLFGSEVITLDFLLVLLSFWLLTSGFFFDGEHSEFVCVDELETATDDDADVEEEEEEVLDDEDDGDLLSE